MEKTLEEKIAGLEADLATEKAAHDKTSAEAKIVIEGMKTKMVAKDKKIQKESITVKHDKVSYNVVIPQFHVGGKMYKAAELKDHPTVIETLVKNGSSVLEKVAAE